MIPLPASRYKKFASDADRAGIILCPGVEEVATFFDALSELFAARRLVGKPGAAVLPARARLVATALHIPSQARPAACLGGRLRWRRVSGHVDREADT